MKTSPNSNLLYKQNAERKFFVVWTKTGSKHEAEFRFRRNFEKKNYYQTTLFFISSDIAYKV